MLTGCTVVVVVVAVVTATLPSAIPVGAGGGTSSCGRRLSDVSRAVNKESDKATYPISRRREHSGSTASI